MSLPLKRSRILDSIRSLPTTQSKQKVLAFLNQHLNPSPPLTTLQQAGAVIRGEKSPRLFNADLDRLEFFLSSLRQQKSVRRILQGSIPKPLSAHITSFLPPSSMKSIAQTSSTTNRAFHQSIPLLQHVDPTSIKYVEKFLQKLPQLTSLKELDLDRKVLSVERVRALSAALPHLKQLQVRCKKLKIL